VASLARKPNSPVSSVVCAALLAKLTSSPLVSESGTNHGCGGGGGGGGSGAGAGELRDGEDAGGGVEGGAAAGPAADGGGDGGRRLRRAPRRPRQAPNRILRPRGTKYT